ncbi:MAG: response regulator [Deltaproteobacteria bacterium]|nr:response regulator [Deltaproteobacteria bacterium]
MERSGVDIVLVDDDPDFVEITSSVLARAGHRVRAFDDPDEAFEFLRGHPADLVVSDLMVKTLDAGFGLARRLKASEETRHIPIIIVTAASSQRGFDFTPHTDAELASMSADAFFNKPVEPAALLEAVRRLTGHTGG